jgi:hypothetical protein
MSSSSSGLAKMYESYGKDSRLNPQALLDSTLPKEL